jgi:mono/diheme cytochrome c family protein
MTNSPTRSSARRTPSPPAGSPTPASATSATTAPARAGPNLFATKLSDQRFLETVIQGRKGTQMPAFGLRLSPDEVWQIHAFVKSTDYY